MSPFFTAIPYICNDKHNFEMFETSVVIKCFKSSLSDVNAIAQTPDQITFLQGKNFGPYTAGSYQNERILTNIAWSNFSYTYYSKMLNFEGNNFEAINSSEYPPPSEISNVIPNERMKQFSYTNLENISLEPSDLIGQPEQLA